MELHVTLVKWNLVSVRLEIVLVLAQDSCMVCAERTTGFKNFLGTPDGLLGDIGQVEARFRLFGDSINLDVG
jgi:hypothetical protein